MHTRVSGSMKKAKCFEGCRFRGCTKPLVGFRTFAVVWSPPKPEAVGRALIEERAGCGRTDTSAMMAANCCGPEMREVLGGWFACSSTRQTWPTTPSTTRAASACGATAAPQKWRRVPRVLIRTPSRAVSLPESSHFPSLPPASDTRFAGAHVKRPHP